MVEFIAYFLFNVKYAAITTGKFKIRTVTAGLNQVSAKPTLSVSIKHHTDSNTFSYHVNGDEKPVPFSSLEAIIADELKDAEDPTFSIYADRTVPIEKVVDLMNIAKRNKFKVILATSPE